MNTVAKIFYLFVFLVLIPACGKESLPRGNSLGGNGQGVTDTNSSSLSCSPKNSSQAITQLAMGGAGEDVIAVVSLSVAPFSTQIMVTHSQTNSIEVYTGQDLIITFKPDPSSARSVLGHLDATIDSTVYSADFICS